MAFERKIDFDKAIAADRQANPRPVVPELTFWQKLMIRFFGWKRADTHDYGKLDFVDYKAEDPYENLGSTYCPSLDGAWNDLSSSYSPNLTDKSFD